MIRILTIVFLVFLGITLACESKADPYLLATTPFPDESSAQGLPYAIPCVTITAFDGGDGIKCTWMPHARNIQVYDRREKRQVEWVNQIAGRGLNGTCREGRHFVGHWDTDVRYVLSLWYYLDKSSDGQPIAYRSDTGPLSGGPVISYVDAGSHLWSFYRRHGLPDAHFKPLFDQLYSGGYTQFMLDAARNQTRVKPPASKITTTWCSRQVGCYARPQKIEPVIIRDLHR